MPGKKRFDDQVAVVTGASSGLGRRLAVDLADAGATVVAIARSADALDELAARPDHRIIPAPGDVTDEAALTTMLRAIESEHGRIDVLVNAAGWEEATRVEAADV
jgi:NADP-dependent 3-hydroxy acid dehydrogenase YdfG